MRTIVSILMSMLALSTGAQVHTDETLYVYRNDGAFDAFFFSDIDSITYSTIGTDGIVYDNYVVQEVWTPDSIFRIPLAVIDSVGFIAPPTIVNEDVFSLTVSHVPYIISADTLGFVMSNTTPVDMLPHKGNIVVAEPECTSFPNGIIARVRKMEETERGYEYLCDKASIDDVYDQIVMYDVINTDLQTDSVNTTNVSNKKISAVVNGDLWNKQFNETFTYSGTTTDFFANSRACWSVKICKTLSRPMTAEIELRHLLTSDVKFNAKSEADIAPSPMKIGQTIKAGRISFPHPLLRFIWFEPQISLYGYFEEHGSVDIDFAAHFNRLDDAKWVYANGEWTFAYNAINEPAIDVASLSMKGYVEVGLQPEIMIALNGSPTGFGITSRFGLKQTADFKFDALEYFDTGIYEALKETKSETYRTMSVSLFAQAGLFEDEAIHGEYNMAKKEDLLISKYLLPTFAEYYQVNDNSYHRVAVSVERDVILPVNLDMALYDGDGNLVKQTNDNDVYGTFEHYYYDFNDLTEGKKYTAYPLVKIGNVQMRATPAIPLDYCPATIDDISLNTVYYNRESSKPNEMYFDVQASLTEQESIAEWGIYSNDTFFPFQSVDNTATDTYRYSISEYGNGNTSKVDYENFIFEITGKIGIYVKKQSQADGKLKLLKRPIKEFTLLYDTKPSLIMSNPVITGTEIIDQYVDDHGNTVTQYQTHCSYTATLSGAFWIDYIDGGISGGSWHLTDNSPWYPNQDVEFESSYRPKYWSNSQHLDFSVWKVLHIRNSTATINSNYMNFYGENGLITGVDVSSSAASSNAYKIPMNVNGHETGSINFVEEKGEPKLILSSNGQRPKSREIYIEDN